MYSVYILNAVIVILRQSVWEGNVVTVQTLLCEIAKLLKIKII